MLRPEEKITFENFQATEPNFAHAPVECAEGPDPPDFICVDPGGRRIGVELGEWLNPKQMAANVERERQEDRFVGVIRSDTEEPPPNVELVWIDRKEDSRLEDGDAEAFRTELYSCIGELNAVAASEFDWHEPISKFEHYPALAKYLQRVRVRPRTQSQHVKGVHWIDFSAHGGAYTAQTALDTLLTLIRNKTAKYDGLHKKERLKELYLVAYYDQALIYNTPYFAPGVTLDDVAREAAAEVARNPGQFQKVFLFNALPGERRVIPLYP